jgi:predicted ATP-dependent endonuclease of OLD family
LQVLGLFSANQRFMNYEERMNIVYKILEKIENDKNLLNEEKIKYLIVLDSVERETKQLRRTIRKKLKKKLGKNLFFNPVRNFEKEKKEIKILEQRTYIESVDIKNFTCFSELSISFVRGINFIIGENSTGKTHLIKIIYSIISGLHQAKTFSVPIKNEIGEQLLAKEIVEVFKPDFLGRLCSREKSEIYLSIQKTDGINNDYLDISFIFTKEEKESIKIESLTQNTDIPIILFIPVKEVLSFTTYFIDYYENHITEFDKTYYNLLKALSRAPLKKDSEKYKAIESLLSSLKISIGGEVFKKEHKFYILEDSGERETSLIAEGQRKLAMLYYLILTDNLKKEDILIWDEPDSSLNPKMIQNLAQALVELAQRGIQIFITSHNLFFMKELDNLRLKSKEKLNIKYFSFVKSKNQILVEEGSKLTDLNTIVSLDELLLQEDRRQELLDQLEASND